MSSSTADAQCAGPEQEDHDLEDGKEPGNEAAAPKARPRKLFGLKQSARSTRRPTVNPYDYEQKYGEDPYGEELGPNARFWRVHLDESQAFDTEMVEGWRDTLDVLLVFAGLFSAVVTTLVVQSSQTLQPDYAQISASLLTELIAIQRAWANGQSIDTVPSSQLALGYVSPSALEKWCNGLWFISLALSLSAALMAVLIKQWLQAYNSNISGTPKHQALIRQFRLIGIERWHVPLIVGLLPMILHMSLLLFFAGLSLYIFSFDIITGGLVGGLAVFFYTLYFAANIMPMFDPQCPYKTPVSHYGYMAVRSGVELMYDWLRRHSPDVDPYISLSTGRPVADTSSGMTTVQALLGALARLLSRAHPDTWTSSTREADTVIASENELAVSCLTWAFSTSSNPTVASITVQAASGLPLRAKPITHRPMLVTLKHDILSCFRRAGGDQSMALTLVDGQEQRVERLSRSLLHFADAGDGFVLRVLSNLKPVVLRSRRSSEPEMPELEGTILALSASIPCATAASRTALFPYLLPIDTPKFRLRLTDSISSFRALLPFSGISPTAGIRLHPTLWHTMLKYLAYENYHPLKSCVHLALFIWHSAGRAHEYAPPIFRQPLTTGALSLYTLATADPDFRCLVNDTVHRLLCGSSCSESQSPSAPPNSMRSHMLQRAFECYASEFRLLPLIFKLSTVTRAFSEVDDANIGFLAREVDLVTREEAWSLLDTVTTIVGRPGVSLQTHNLFFYVYYLEEGRATPSIPVSSVRPLLLFLVKLLAASPVVDNLARTHATHYKIVDLIHRAIDLHPTEALSAIIRHDVLAALQPLAQCSLHDPRSIRLTEALESTLAAYLQSVLGSLERDDFSTEATMAQDHVDYLSHFDEQSTSHLVWCLWLDMLGASMTYPRRRGPLHVALQKLAQLTPHAPVWGHVLDMATRQPMPLALSMSLGDAYGMKIYCEFAGVLSQARGEGVVDMPEVYVYLTGHDDKTAEAWRCAVRDADAESSPPHGPLLINVSDIVSLMEYNRRWRRVYGAGEK
ncbi:hypothetical protein BD626DRAFT_630015 [Schizophyllum amplum]|uniref:DUF6535 domain-containing protein n=1 Tax=Schizophyllum amplum TaxID=97359 RepID=A0A550CFC9_9AGAR|nr:hypothetical protein BD626DRAFT_630015 [Auriculariopsis ampla]